MPALSYASSQVSRALASARSVALRTLKNVSMARPSKCSDDGVVADVQVRERPYVLPYVAWISVASFAEPVRVRRSQPVGGT